MRVQTLLLLTGCLITSVLHAQNKKDTTLKVPVKFLEQISSRNRAITNKVKIFSLRSLKQLQRQEAKIQRRLAKIDSVKAKELFTDGLARYNSLDSTLVKTSPDLKDYLPALDTISSSLQFLKATPGVIRGSAENGRALAESIQTVNELKTNLNQAETIKKFINDRKQYLKSQVEQFGFYKELKAINKQAYYYSEQINEYKSLLKDRKKAEQKAIQWLSKTKQFKEFMRKHSALASLFRLPGNDMDPATSAGLAGLQTRVQVNNLIQSQLASGGPGAQEAFRQNLQDAQSQLNQLKDQLIKKFPNGSASSDMTMPEGFKPNPEKTKSLKKRLELGTNFQSNKGSGFFPVTSDIGLSIGYKLNPKSVIGIGASYRVGWGQSIKKIKITHQGIGLRSFIDWKLKGSFWITGGFEMNYRAAFKHFEELRDINSWQKATLLGVSKTVSLKSKFFKKTKLQLLFDFLSYQNIPRTQPLLFRVGYNF